MQRSAFRSPGKEYRPSPFWSWNDRLEAGELRRQVREFADKGFGGYFMHSRVGLKTRYLGKEWMKMIRACLTEGKKVDQESWLYDEDKWPSGFAGGLVPEMDDAYRSRALRVDQIQPDELKKVLADKTTVAIFACWFDEDGELAGFSRLTHPEPPDDHPLGAECQLWAFRRRISPKNNWFNGQTYADLLNPEAVQAFLKITYEPYARRFGKQFGEFMPGMFTDEPCYFGLWGGQGGQIVWTDQMPDYFQQKNGYDLVEQLPLLIFPGPGYRKLRHDFYRTATARFVEAFSKPVFDCCEKYALKLTGHYLAEDTLASQIQVIGAAMPHYEFMQAPGVDHLSRNIDNPLTLKQCSSASHQFGRNRILSELFGCSGHSMTFEDQKWIADWHFALGVTFICQHLTLYSMKGDRKRDYPPTFSDHQPYWKDYGVMNDYLSRVSYALQQGRFAADMLLLHPIASAWCEYDPTGGNKKGKSVGTIFEGGPVVQNYHDTLVKVMNDLLGLHREFDLGDEMIMERHAEVAGDILKVAQGEYRVVVVPPSLTWSMATLVLLRKFLAGGGKVVFVGKRPTHVEGEPNKKVWDALLNDPDAYAVSEDRHELATLLARLRPRSVSVTDKTGREVEDILTHHRILPDGRHIYFLANTSREETYEAHVLLAEAGEVRVWDAATGKVTPLPAAVRDGTTLFNKTFVPVESLVVVIDPRRKPERIKPAKPKGERLARLIGPWNHRRSHPNSLTLDVCRWRLGKGRWRGKTPVWKVRHAAFNAAGLEKYVGVQPWYLEAKGVKPKKEVPVQMQFVLHSELDRPQAGLVLETAERYTVKVNGKMVPTKTNKWHWDRQFSLLDISKQIRSGENRIELECRYNMDTEIEDLYVIGEFGVSRVNETTHTLTAEPSQLKMGDWVDQGYPFYAGNMTYETDLDLPRLGKKDRIVVRLVEASGALFNMSVNGRKAKPLAFAPFEMDVTDQVKSGRNRLRIEIVGTLRNTFGPLHHRDGDLGSCGPAHFVDEQNWTDSYQFAPYGILGPVEILRMK